MANGAAWFAFPAAPCWYTVGGAHLVRRHAMPSEMPRSLVEFDYCAAAQEYLNRLPLEHFTEATSQATQRGISLKSLALVRATRSDVHVFNELLVQYPRKGKKKPGQVVPDNMVVIHDGPIDAELSYDVPLQPEGPLLVLEYVSKRSKRKDYEGNREHYERRLKVPYYLIFYPQAQDLSLFHHNGRSYVSVEPNENERYPIPELELEAAMLDGWVRFWFRGELLPLPAELREQRDGERRARLAAEEDNARLRAEVARLKGGARNHK
jgi:Uma2 family endonuclease